MKSALAGAIGAAALAFAAATPSLAQSYSYQGPGYSYQGPGYSYTQPPYSYQPPPYSYTPPSYGYEPPGYVYTPPGEYRRGYYSNMPEYNRSYQYPPSVYENPNFDQSWRQRRYRDPYYNRFGNPRNPTDQGHAAPPYESPAR